MDRSLWDRSKRRFPDSFLDNISPVPSQIVHNFLLRLVLLRTPPPHGPPQSFSSSASSSLQHQRNPSPSQCSLQDVFVGPFAHGKIFHSLDRIFTLLLTKQATLAQRQAIVARLNTYSQESSINAFHHIGPTRRSVNHIHHIRKSSPFASDSDILKYPTWDGAIDQEGLLEGPIT